jgi:hypothetical protein
VANIGRNDLCPCGSGRKYKHCCLAQVDAERATRVRVREAEARVVPALLEFALERWGQELLAQAWADFVFEMEDLPDDLTSDPDFSPLFLPWFIFAFVADPNAEEPLPNAPATPLATVYLSEGRTTDPLERELLESASAGNFSFHSVERATTGSLTLKDILTGTTVRVLEDIGTAGVEPGSILFALTATVDRVSILVGCSTLVIPPTWHNPIIDFREDTWPERRPTAAELREYDFEIRDFYFEIAEALLDPQPPTLTNTDGELIRLTGLTFDVRCSVQEAFDALQSLGAIDADSDLETQRSTDGTPAGVTVRWQKADGTLLGLLRIEPGRLTADVNSEERAARVREEIESRLGDRSVYVGSEESALEDLDAPIGDPSDELTGPDVEALYAQLTERHWDELVDEQVPALGNETPRAAATTALGRERLEAMFAEFAWMNKEQPPYLRVNIDRLRERLGM